jgi:hypothetical protein
MSLGILRQELLSDFCLAPASILIAVVPCVFRIPSERHLMLRTIAERAHERYRTVTIKHLHQQFSVPGVLNAPQCKQRGVFCI